MTNENDKAITGSFTKAANGNQPFYVDIVDFKTADAETKAKMEKLISTIDLEDMNTITTYAKDPTHTLMHSSEAIVQRAQNATAFLGGFAKIKEQLANFDFDTVGKMAQDYTKKVQRNLSLAKNSAVVRFVKKCWFGLTGIGRKQTAMDDIRHEINKSLIQLGEVVADLEKSKDQIPGVATDLRNLEKARLTAYSDYGLYLGAALERYNRAQDEVEKLQSEITASPLKQMELENKSMALTVLNTKLTDMDSFHKSCLVQLKTIKDLKEALAMSQLKIDSHLTISQGQWMALLAEASTAAQVSEIAENIKAADDFGDKIFSQSQNLSDMTKAMVRTSFGHGTLDPVKVIAHLQKRTQDIQEDLAFMTEFNKKMEAQRAALDEAGRQFRVAASKVVEPRSAQIQQAAPAALPAPEQGTVIDVVPTKVEKEPVRKDAPKP